MKKSTEAVVSPHKRPLYEAAKRALDVAVASLLLVSLAPLMTLLAGLVRLSSPGPILYRQHRVGRGGKLFWLYKFRTMRADSRGLGVTASGDPRITPIGRWLRNRKLDELPQLLSVLRGDMSLVGPRPEIAEYVRHYTDAQRQVLTVRPGITGVSQLEFRHEEQLLAGRADVESFYIGTVMPAKLRMDLRYVQEHTLAGDLYLLLRTAGILFVPGKSKKAANSGNVEPIG